VLRVSFGLDTLGGRPYEGVMLQSGGGDLRIESVTARPLSVALVEPFTIASGRLDATRAVEIDTRLLWNGKRATGLGEAACLPPVTREDQPDVLREIDRLSPSLLGLVLPDGVPTLAALAAALEGLLPQHPVTRAGIEISILDAMAQIAGVPLRVFLGGGIRSRTRTLETDITIAIAEPERMARLALDWCSRGFRVLKIKVGADFESDTRALEAIGCAVPGVRLRIDANAGLSPRQTIALARECESLGLVVECWEQPCAASDLDAMGEVAAALEAPVIADESVKTIEDLMTIVERRCADGVNLKLAKMGGLLPAYRIGMKAKEHGLKLMAGGMVETRLGMTAGAHLACALGGVDFVDLDTAWLLESDPYEGGYRAEGPHYTLDDAAGLGVTRRR
jgi:L-alanine-DL-glutamate epimerase-like enolase superfamily enzyme